MDQQTKKLLRTLSAAALVALTVQPSRAAYEDVGVGARATGMSNAVTAVADDVYSIHYNPAGLATLARPELATSYSRLLTGLSDNSNLQNSFFAFGTPLKGGRWGAAGLGWNYFTLDSLYRESTVYLSYGRSLNASGSLLGGFSSKYLSRSLGSTSATDNAVGPTGVVTPGQVDPVLQNGSRGNLDLDWGLLYRPWTHWSLGLAVQHMFEPNVAFSPRDQDKLGRNLKFGLAYRLPFSTLSLDADFVKAPDGSTDKQAALAAEKWLPTLVHGAFGVRGSLAAGTRSYRQLGAGLSYRMRQVQFDYGFTIPLGGLAGTSGTHRLGLTFRFGRLPQEAELGEAVKENLADLAAPGTPEFTYQMQDVEVYKRRLVEELLHQAKAAVTDGRFADGLEKLDQAGSLLPGDGRIAGSRERLRLIAGFYPALTGFASDAFQAAVYDGALALLSGNDAEAVDKVIYAQSLRPGDATVKALLQALAAHSDAARSRAVVALSGTVAPVVPPAAPSVPPTPAQEAASEMLLVDEALRQREYDKVLTLASHVIAVDPSNALAYQRMGAAYYALSRYSEALESLETSFRFETDEASKALLAGYIDALQRLAQKAAAKPAVPLKTVARAPVVAAPARTAQLLAPEEIEHLYESGVDLYSQDRLLEAEEAFRRVLSADPANVSARRALRRVESELAEKRR